MQVRSLVTLICPECNNTRTIRKDGAGKLCRSCKARQNSKLKIGKFQRLEGKKFGKLTVVSFSKQIDSKFYWLCRCDCGNSREIASTFLIRGVSQSCGCIVKKQNGLSTSFTYRSWHPMIQRCYQKSSISYPRYGGKGITVCERWRDSFFNFLEDMGERPIGMTLDRIDSNKGYFKENCRWATPIQQGLNKSNNHMIQAFSQNKPLTEWAYQYSISWSTILKRIRLGWSNEDAISKPVRAKKK